MTDTPTSELSERELEILKLLATGASNKDIAQRLVISPNTVKVHLRNIFTKIGVVSRTEATLYAIQHGVTSPKILTSPAGLETNHSSESADTFTQSDGIAGNDGYSGGLLSSPTKIEPQLAGEIRSDWRQIALLSITLLAVLLIVFILRGVLIPQATVAAPTINPVSTNTAPYWDVKAPIPLGRSGMAGAVYENTIYVFAGESKSGATGEVDRYDPASNKWEKLTAKPNAVSEIGAALLGEKIYIPGGKLASGQYTNILEVYDPRHDTWERKASVPISISAYAIASFEGKMYIFGGWDGKGYLKIVFVYDPNRDAWNEGTVMTTPRAYASAEVANDKIYVIGGYDGSRSLTSNEAYIPAREGSEDPWEERAPLPEGRYAMGVASLADIIYIAGGQTDTKSAPAILEYLPQQNTWQTSQNPPQALGSGLILEAVNPHLYALGGKVNGTPQTFNQAYQAIYTILFPITNR